MYALPAVVALGLVGAAAGYFFAGKEAPATEAASNTPTEVQVQCTNIKHAYALWMKTTPRLHGLHEQNLAVAKMDAEKLNEDAEAFFKAVSGYKDEPSKKLSLAVGQYRVDLGLATLAPALGSAVDRETQLKAQQALKKADDSYTAFLALTCPAL